MIYAVEEELSMVQGELQEVPHQDQEDQSQVQAVAMRELEMSPPLMKEVHLQEVELLNLKVMRGWIQESEPLKGSKEQELLKKEAHQHLIE